MSIVATLTPAEATVDRSTGPRADAGAIALVGNPNVGKSALFGALTGRYVTVSNYPGTTVELSTGTAQVGGRRTTLIDTPGTGSFLPSSEDERVSRDVLLSGEARRALVVADAKNLDRGLLLALQLAEMQLPFVLCLNMMDEAVARGRMPDAERLAGELGVEVVPTVAVRREGIGRLLTALEAPRTSRWSVRYPGVIEDGLRALAPLLPDSPLGARALGLMVLSGDSTLASWLGERLGAAELAEIESLRLRVQAAVSEPVGYLLSQVRLTAAHALASPDGGAAADAVRPDSRLERLTTHRVWGLPILALVLYACYLFVGVLGASTLVGLLENRLFNGVINPWAIAAAGRYIPWAIVRDLLVGPYGMLTMALTYALALVLPIVGTFFIAFGALEDSGYLPRLAVMVNRLFRKMGLNGKAVLPMVLGLGCDTMATLTTRILETPKERLIVILLLALGVPCSAQMAVILALLGPLSPMAMVIWLLVVVSVIVLVGRLASAVIPGRGSDFVLELPPLRWPALGNILVKTMARIEWYLKEAVPLFVLGTLILFVGDRLHLLGGLERMAEPIVTGALGLPKETAGAFVIGFLRRDFGAAGLYRLAREGRLDSVQILVAAVTMTLFIPCIANFFMIVKERGWRTASAVAAFIIPFAVGVGAGLNLLMRTVAPWVVR